MRAPTTAAPRRPTRFAGWRIVALSAIVLGLTGPGQTMGVSVFVDPMLAALDLTRSELSTAYLVGTLTGAVALPRIGRFLDDRGTRVAMAVVGGLFGVVLAAMAGVTGILTLGLGFVGIRMLGQGGLSLVATTAVAPWFDRRRGLAVGITTAVGSALMSLVPLATVQVIDLSGWRLAWVATALAVWLIVLPIALRGIVDRPGLLGQFPDGNLDGPSADEVAAAADRAFTRAEALRTAMFWAVAGAVAATGMIGTGLVFHQIDLLGEQGLTPVQAAANFLPQVAAALAATVLIGAMVDRFASRWVLAVSMGLLAAAMAGVSFVQPGFTAMLYGMAVGAAGSAARALEAASFPKLFGLAHLGSIRGVVTSVSVASTAFGPLALSLGRDLTGGYTEVLLVLLVIPLGVGVFGLLAPEPRRPARTSSVG